MRLQLNRKLLSLRERFHIVDEAGGMVVDCSRPYLAVRRTLELADAGGASIGQAVRRVFAWSPTWDVTFRSIAGPQEFTLRRRIFSWRRCLDVTGGAYDGACVRGNFWDLDFAIERGDQAIAAVDEKLLSLTRETVVDVHLDADAPFVCALVCVLVASQAEDSERRNRAGSAFED